MVRPFELRRLEDGDQFTELLALLRVFHGEIHSRPRGTRRTGIDIDAPAVEARHGDLETVALRTEAVDHSR